MKKNIFLLAVIVIYTSPLFSQIEVNPDVFDKAKDGKTYFVLDNKDYAAEKPFIAVLKKYWTITPVEVINEKDMGEYIVEGNSFFKFHQVVTERTNLENISYRKSFLVPFGQGNTHFNDDGMKAKEDVFLDFFCFDNVFIKKYQEKKRPYMYRDFYEIARIAISLPSRQVLQTDKDLFMFEGLATNWEPGYLKNYLQYIQKAIRDNNPKKLYTQTFDHKLSVLKTDSLYLPDNIESNMSDKDVNNGKKLFENYSHSYSLVNAKDLSSKILSSATPVYYLLYVHFMPDKFIEVVNSLTGEIIYANISTSKYVKQADFKDLDTEINKN